MKSNDFFMLRILLLFFYNYTSPHIVDKIVFIQLIMIWYFNVYIRLTLLTSIWFNISFLLLIYSFSSLVHSLYIESLNFLNLMCVYVLFMLSFGFGLTRLEMKVFIFVCRMSMMRMNETMTTRTGRSLRINP